MLITEKDHILKQCRIYCIVHFKEPTWNTHHKYWNENVKR